MNKPLLVIHNHDLLTFSAIKKEIGEEGASQLDGVLINGEKYSFFRRLLKKKTEKGEEWRQWHKLVQILSHPQITKIPSEPSKVSDVELSRALRDILNDGCTFLVADRRKPEEKNCYITTFEVMHYTINSISLLKKTKPSCILFQTTPHDLTNWVFGKVAESMRVPVYILKASALPWRVGVKQGIAGQKDVSIPVAGKSTLSSEALDFVTKNKSSYSDAQPEYEKERIKKGVHKKWSWTNEILTNTPKNPKNWRKAIKNSIKKKRAYNEYISAKDAKRNPGTLYGVFFLHYQPERTTVPEGGIYGQQINAIQELALSIPDGSLLVVKEHPSIFRRPFSDYVRPRGFYKALSSIPNVMVSAVEHDTFDLIDNAGFVSTITGTVGFQALCRNKPVVTFGNAPYKDAPYVFRADVDGTSEAVRQALTAPDDFSNDFIEYLLKTEQSTISHETFSFNNGLSTKEMQEIAYARAIKYFLSNAKDLEIELCTWE